MPVVRRAVRSHLSPARCRERILPRQQVLVALRWPEGSTKKVIWGGRIMGAEVRAQGSGEATGQVLGLCAASASRANRSAFSRSRFAWRAS
jgi:hypothetical protein